MPIEVAVVVAGVVAMFAVFALALAWADFYSGKSRRPGPAE